MRDRELAVEVMQEHKTKRIETMSDDLGTRGRHSRVIRDSSMSMTYEKLRRVFHTLNTPRDQHDTRLPMDTDDQIASPVSRVPASDISSAFLILLAA